jgi:hypothetical protein
VFIYFKATTSHVINYDPVWVVFLELNVDEFNIFQGYCLGLCVSEI